jgi:hypothetical protein
MAAAAVLLVAAIAAVVSYIHTERLAVTHGQSAPVAAAIRKAAADITEAGQ